MNAVSLDGLRVAVDVQHLYRTDKPHDRGTVFTLPGGLHVTEGAAATGYALALSARLRAWGAAVLTNAQGGGFLVGTYHERNRQADAWGAHCYLACHVNAGGGSYALAEYLCDAPPETRTLAELVMRPLVASMPLILVAEHHPLVAGARGRICIEGGHPIMSAVILEPFFGDTPRNAPLFQAPRLAELGRALAYGVADWWQAIGHSAKPANLPA